MSARCLYVYMMSWEAMLVGKYGRVDVQGNKHIYEGLPGTVQECII